MLPLLIFLEGVVAFVSPCILPLLPVYLIYLAGDPTTQRKHSRLVNSCGFVAGFTLIFVGLGAAATALGSFLGHHKGLLTQISGVIMLILGLAFLFELNIPLIKHGGDAPIINHAGLLGILQSLLFGMAFAVAWTPCVGTFLASALTLAANTQTVWKGMGLLFLFSLGLGLPFLLLALLYEQLQFVLGFLKRHGRGVRIAGSALLMLIGVGLLTGALNHYL